VEGIFLDIGEVFSTHTLSVIRKDLYNFLQKNNIDVEDSNVKKVLENRVFDVFTLILVWLSLKKDE